MTGAVLLNARGAAQLPLPDGVPISGEGIPAIGPRRLNLLDTSIWTQYDPGSRLASAPSDGGEGTGISIPLAGGLAAITDPFDGVYWTAPVARLGLFSRRIGSASHIWTLTVQLKERTAAGLSSDTNIAIGVCNEATDSATIDALVGGIRYATATRNILGASVANGTGAVSAGGISTIRGNIIAMTKSGLGSTARVQTYANHGVDGSNVFVAQNTGQSAVASFGDGEPILVVAAWRSATTAGTETPAADFYAWPALSWRPA